jgi:ParD-like antitoxin of type II bacterial toxin-antitoxin system
MAVALKLSDGLIEMAKPYAAAMNHSIAEQIEHWAWLGKAAEEGADSGALFNKVGNADNSC